MHARSAYKSLWKLFMEYANMNGKQILEDRKQDKEHKWEKKALAFRTWLTEKDYSPNTLKTAIGVVRGFFNYHYEDLKFRHNTIAKLSRKPKRKREDYKLSKETIARMSVQANLRDRYVLVVGKSLGLRAIDFINLKIGDFTHLNLDSEAPISMGKVYTVKEGVEASAFLDSDAIPIVKAYLESIDTSDPNAKMLNIKKNELTAVLQRLAKKAHLNLGGRHLRFHCLRKFLIDRLSSVMSESKWKMVVGKTVSEDAYVSDLDLRKGYAKAMPETTFSNHNHSAMQLEAIEREFTARDEMRKRDIETLKNQYKTLEETFARFATEVVEDRKYMRNLTPGQLKEHVKHKLRIEKILDEGANKADQV